MPPHNHSRPTGARAGTLDARTRAGFGSHPTTARSAPDGQAIPATLRRGTGPVDDSSFGGGRGRTTAHETAQSGFAYPSCIQSCRRWGQYLFRDERRQSRCFHPRCSRPRSHHHVYQHKPSSDARSRRPYNHKDAIVSEEGKATSTSLRFGSGLGHNGIAKGTKAATTVRRSISQACVLSNTAAAAATPPLSPSFSRPPRRYFRATLTYRSALLAVSEAHTHALDPTIRAGGWLGDDLSQVRSNGGGTLASPEPEPEHEFCSAKTLPKPKTKTILRPSLGARRLFPRFHDSIISPINPSACLPACRHG